VLPVEEAVAFLQSRTGRSDAAGAGTLSDALGRLPLALDHAAAYCKRTQVHFADYAEKASSLINTAPRGTGYPRSVAATFDLAITQAVTQCPTAEGLMAYLAQGAPERIPMIVVEGAVDDEAERLQALAALAEVSLVRHHPFEDGAPAVTVHRLVQAVARARSEANGSAQDALRRVIARLVAIYPEEGGRDPQTWSLCAQLAPHLLALSAAGPDAASDMVNWSKLLGLAGGYFVRRAAYLQAEPLVRDALAIREKALGPEHFLMAQSLDNLAVVLCNLGDIAGARPLFERALAIEEKVRGPEHPDTAHSLDNLAGLLGSLGDIAGARPLFERALAIREKALGPEHPDTAESLDMLALLEEQRDFAGARSLQERALAIRETVLGPEHPDTATSLDHLAGLLRNQGDIAGARPLFERALAIREKALGPEHPITGNSLNSLAGLLYAQGDFAGARPLSDRALAIRETALGPGHPDTASSLNNLAALLYAQGDIAGARPLCKRALAIREKVLGPEHPDTNHTRCNLSALLLNTGQPAEALTLAETALTAHDKVLGRDHSLTKDSARATADALDALSRTEEAKALRERYGVTSSDSPEPS
jgi:tetratricopeptide (TPR) repeat protein